MTERKRQSSFAPSHAPTAASRHSRIHKHRKAQQADVLHWLQRPVLPARSLPRVSPKMPLRRPEQQEVMYLLRRQRKKDRGQLGVKTQTAKNLPLHSQMELPTQRREGIRSLVVEAMMPPRIPPPPYRVATRAQDNQRLQQRVPNQPPPPGSLRPRTVEHKDPRRHRQAKKETGMHRSPLLPHQPLGLSLIHI